MELEAAKQLIKKYTAGHADYVRKVEVAKRYYRNENDVLFGKPKETTDDEKPLRNADNRIPRNFHGLIVNQKASYAFTKPPTFDVGTKEGNETVTKLLGDEYAADCMSLCVNAANASVAWVHYWDNGEGFEWAVMESEQIIPVFDKGLKKKLLAVLRVYGEFDEFGEEYAVYEYWTDKVCQSFRRNVTETIDEGLICYDMFPTMLEGEMAAEYEHGYEEVPFIPFWNNNIHTDDLKNIKRLIDVYDKVYSGFINDLEDVQELIFILTGYGGTDLSEFLQDLKKYKAIKLDVDEGAGVNTLNIEIPIEARNSVLDATRKAIFEQGQGFDPRPENFGNQSGEALKFMYCLLEMKTGLMETQFRTGFNKLVRAICRSCGISCDTIIQTWKRTCIKNDTERAQICKDSVGVISQRTIVENHPFVEDADVELKQMEKEKAAAQKEEEIYQNFAE